MSRYTVNQLVQELFRQPDRLKRFMEDRAQVYEEYGLGRDERMALDEGTPDALTRAGLHPILQMHYLLACNPDVARLITINAYRFTEEKE